MAMIFLLKKLKTSGKTFVSIESSIETEPWCVMGAVVELMWNLFTSTIIFKFSPLPDSSFVPPLIYSVLGSSRHIAIGPVAVVSLLLGTLLRNEINPTTHPASYLQLALSATFFAGVFQAGLGLLRFIFCNPQIHCKIKVLNQLKFSLNFSPPFVFISFGPHVC